MYSHPLTPADMSRPTLTDELLMVEVGREWQSPTQFFLKSLAFISSFLTESTGGKRACFSTKLII